MYYSQSGQDEWVLNQIPKGFFVDVGAYDGVQTSNSFALEQAGWKGICIEGNRNVFKDLLKNRSCLCINQAVSDYNGMGFFGTDRIGDTGYDVQITTLENLLVKYDAPRRIDYLSLDIEGHELKALEGMDFDYYDVKLITVETNVYCDGTERKDKIFELLTGKGFTRTHEDVWCLDVNYLNLPYEDWYSK